MRPSSSRILAASVALAAALALVLVPGLSLSPAGAAARVSIDNGSGSAVVDPTYATTLTLRGSGFQSIKKGYGGIYVLFGVVKGSWRPSKGGRSGVDYLTVPDSESKNNAGYARFIAFPGSETAGSANGGLISAKGTWSAKITVPGGTFTTTDAQQRVVKVDCRVSVCGVITVGAHGVANGRNETFTRVRVGKVAGAEENRSTTTSSAAATPSTGSGVATAPVAQVPVAPTIAANPALEVDRASARPGRVLSFHAEGLRPGSQVSATFEDGRAAVGPMTVGANGEVAGVLTLPTDLRTGTYELRIVGGDAPPSVRFAVVADTRKPVLQEDDPRPIVFVAASAAVLAGAVAFVGHRWRRRRAD